MIIDPFLPFMLRIVLGSLFFFQAYDKIFRIGLKKSFLVFQEDCQKRKVPLPFMQFSIILSGYIELIGGMFLILGLVQPYAMLFLGINLIMVSIGLGFLQGLWDTRYFFPRITLLSLLYLIPAEQNLWALDSLLDQFF